MFDIGWMELMIVGTVMLLVVGPKELPGLLRTIGKYVGVVKRQANEFRAQFDEAIKESDFSDLKKDMENLGEETESSMRDAKNALDEDLAEFDDHSSLDDDDYDDDWVDSVASPDKKSAESKSSEKSADKSTATVEDKTVEVNTEQTDVSSDSENGADDGARQSSADSTAGENGSMNGSAPANGHAMSDPISQSGDGDGDGAKAQALDERKSDA